MPVDEVSWSPGNGSDFHLVPGLASPRLDHLLTIFHDGLGTGVRADSPPPGVIVTFAPTFTPGDPGTRGVAVDGATGEVTVTSPLAPQPRLLDFLVLAHVVDGLNPPFIAHIRFHIHAGLTRMWLTPAQLTVRQNAREARFSVIAEFVDGTYGDVSNWSPWEEPGAQDRTFVHLTTSQQPVPLVTWGSSAQTSLGVRSGTGRLLCSSAAAAADIQALTPLPGGVASGHAVAAPPWNTPLTVNPVPGPGFLPPDVTPNVLILSEGFPAAERQAFFDKAGLLVARLAVGAKTSPFRELSNRINYFAGFVESPEAGISALSPVDRVLVPGQPAEATEVDVAIPPADVATTPPTIGTPTTPATTTRFLLNEVDTAFGAYLGERPRAQRFDEIRTAGLSPRRFHEDDLDEFLGALRDPAGGDVGKHWKQRGKDDVAILILCRTDHYGGANGARAESGAIICVALGVEEKFHIRAAAAGPGLDIIPDPIPAKVHVELRNTAAHELAHSFTLGDEYGGGGPLPPGFEDDIESSANLQARDPRPAPAGQPPRRGLLNAAKQLDADLIKWRWPRLAKAHVLSAAPIPIQAGAEHRLLLSPGHPFERGNIVRLRTRPLPTSNQSVRLEVKSLVGDAEIVVKPVGAGLTGTFPAGSIVMEPVRAPNTAGGLGDDLELVHVGVRNWIGSTSNGVPGHQNPLNADPTLGPNRACPGPEPTIDPTTGAPLPSTPARNFGPGNAPIPPRESAWITGLFEMGRGFDCDVYHPTGACIMGVLSFGPGASSSFQFCWVCRYAMVDFVDPSLHGVMDAAYADRYPT